MAKTKQQQKPSQSLQFADRLCVWPHTSNAQPGRGPLPLAFIFCLCFCLGQREMRAEGLLRSFLSMRPSWEYVGVFQSPYSPKHRYSPAFLPNFFGSSIVFPNCYPLPHVATTIYSLVFSTNSLQLATFQHFESFELGKITSYFVPVFHGTTRQVKTHDYNCL